MPRTNQSRHRVSGQCRAFYGQAGFCRQKTNETVPVLRVILCPGILRNSGSAVVESSNYCGGIPREKIDKNFSKFYQADESHATEGNGVSPAIVKKVTGLHNGSVTVTPLQNSGGKGSGCRYLGRS